MGLCMHYVCVQAAPVDTSPLINHTKAIDCGGVTCAESCVLGRTPSAVDDHKVPQPQFCGLAYDN